MYEKGGDGVKMRELSLFTGAGGGLLGTMLLGWEPIGYVEWDDYCQRVIAARIADGFLPVAPIFSDVREFVKSGAARQYRGFAEVVTAGFPCQPFSVAGKQAGADDERNMWPATIDCIREVRPRFAFLENVPGLLNSGYFGTILGDLAESGYDARWRILSAAELGAPHKRDRLWIVANAHNARFDAPHAIQSGYHEKRNNSAQEQSGGAEQSESKPDCKYVAHAEPTNCRHDVSNAKCNRCNKVEQSDGERTQRKGTKREIASCFEGWWATEPGLDRVAYGVANRVGRLKALGNGQVPAVVAEAWRRLTEA